MGRSGGQDPLIHELREMRDRTLVFRNRRHAGEVLARMLAGKLAEGSRILAIPAGGVPVAAEIAKALGLPLDVAVVSKVTPAWNTEVGYGAVAFDGRVRTDERARAALGVEEADERVDVDRARARVGRRVRGLRTSGAPLVPAGGTAVLVDDGLASGITMETAVEAIRDAGAGHVIVAVPTGHEGAVQRISGVVDEIHCANVRSGRSFAVADAYRDWTDLDDAAVLEILERSHSDAPRRA
jgi:putative phosphoribosyl transferase